MKVLLTIWISAVLLQEVVPNTLVRVPRLAPNGHSTVHTEYEAKYEQKGKNGNESSSIVKGNQEIKHDNCSDNWNEFAEKCATLIKDLIASLANAVSSRPGDATNMHLQIKNSFKHFDSTHNCSCFNHSQLSSLFNNVSTETIRAAVNMNGPNNGLNLNGNCQAIVETSPSSSGKVFGEPEAKMDHFSASSIEQQKELITNGPSGTLQPPVDDHRSLNYSDEKGMKPGEAESSTGYPNNNNCRQIMFSPSRSEDTTSSSGRPKPNLGDFSPNQPIAGNSNQEGHPSGNSYESFTNEDRMPQDLPGPRITPHSGATEETPIEFSGVSMNPPFIRGPHETVPSSSEPMHDSHYQDNNKEDQSSLSHSHHPTSGHDDSNVEMDFKIPGSNPSPLSEEPVTSAGGGIPGGDISNSGVNEVLPKQEGPGAPSLPGSDMQSLPSSETHSSQTESQLPPFTSTNTQSHIFMPNSKQRKPEQESHTKINNEESSSKSYPFSPPADDSVPQMPPTDKGEHVGSHVEKMNDVLRNDWETNPATQHTLGDPRKREPTTDELVAFFQSKLKQFQATDSPMKPGSPDFIDIGPVTFPPGFTNPSVTLNPETVGEDSIVNHSSEQKPISEEHLSKPVDPMTTDIPANAYPHSRQPITSTAFPAPTNGSVLPDSGAEKSSSSLPACSGVDEKPESAGQQPFSGPTSGPNGEFTKDDAHGMHKAHLNNFTPASPEGANQPPFFGATAGPNGEFKDGAPGMDKTHLNNFTPASPESAGQQPFFGPTSGPIREFTKDVALGMDKTQLNNFTPTSPEGANQPPFFGATSGPNGEFTKDGAPGIHNKHLNNFTPTSPESAGQPPFFGPTSGPNREFTKDGAPDMSLKINDPSGNQENMKPLSNEKTFSNPMSTDATGFYPPRQEESAVQGKFEPLEPNESLTQIPSMSNDRLHSSDHLASHDNLGDPLNQDATTAFPSKESESDLPSGNTNPFLQPSTNLPKMWLGEPAVKSSVPNDGFIPTTLNGFQREPVDSQTMSPQKPTTFQTTSMEPTRPQLDMIPPDVLRPMSHTPPSFTTPQSTEVFPIRPSAMLPHRHPEAKDPLHEDDDDDDDCCSCEACSEDDLKQTNHYRTTACRDLEEARKELKAIFDKIKKKLKCGRKASRTITTQ